MYSTATKMLIKLGNTLVNRKILGLICIPVLCTVLTLGLWPFHSPRNDVTWLGNRNGLHFGKYSTVLSHGELRMAYPPNEACGSIEIWLQPRSIWDSGTLLSFYVPPNSLQVSLRQCQSDLLLQALTKTELQRTTIAKLDVDDVFRKTAPVFITITSGIEGTVVYIDGILAKTTPQFEFSTKLFMGHLVLGDSPGRSDSWSGQLLGFAIYHSQLTVTQVYHNYVTWKQMGRPQTVTDERTFGLYLFDEHTGNIVRNNAGPGVDLYIPERYKVMGQMFLEPIWTEFAMSRSYVDAAIKNIVGFIPFGFCFYAYLASALSTKRAALVTVVLGATVSLTIEILQGFIPTRASGTTDIITNTLGTLIGLALYKLITSKPGRYVPCLPLLRK